MRVNRHATRRPLSGWETGCASQARSSRSKGCVWNYQISLLSRFPLSVDRISSRAFSPLSTALFVEFPRLALGIESAFAAHLTTLVDFKPVNNGAVTVVLSGGGAPEERFVAERPTSPGIFRPVARPRHASARQLTVLIETDDITDRHDLGEVIVAGSIEDAAESSEAKHAGAATITFLKEQQWRVEFATAPAGTRRLRESVTANGVIRAQPDGEAAVGAPAAGRVLQTGTAFPRIGAEVRADQVLAVLAPVSSIMGEIMFIALTSDRHTALDLKTTADWVIRRRLLAVPGVSQVVPTGGDTKQYQVVMKPDRLAAYRIGVDQVVEALRETSENTSAGFYVEGGQQHLIHGHGRVRRTEDIGETVVAVREGEPFLVRHLADVTIGAALKLGEGSHNAHPAVVLGIQKQPGANTLDLTKRIDAALDSIEESLPDGMQISRHNFRQADFIGVAIHNVLAALRDGSGLVVAIVLAFLASLRATGITVVAIPLSLVVSILSLKIAGISINTMTLGGMTIALGALVDDAIIGVENVARRLRENGRLPHDERHPAVGVVFKARTLFVRGVVVIAGIFLILFLEFRSASDAALVMANLPLALIGGMAGVYLTGGIISVASIIGFITLFGIATRNGLMMISHIHHLIAHEGVHDARAAVTRGAIERLSPILMTALAAGLALVPLALSGGAPGSEIQTPMAVVILCGLLSSTALNMIVVPTLYLRFGSIHKRRRHLRHPDGEASHASLG